MMKGMKLFLSFIIILGLFVHTVSLAEDDYQTWNVKITDDNYKTWTVTFNQAVDPASIDKNSVYVINEFRRIIPTSVKLLDDGKSLTITPIQMYLSDHAYELVLTRLRSTEKELLTPSVKMPFKITRDKSVTNEMPNVERPSSLPSGSETNGSSNDRNEQVPTNNSPVKEAAIKEIKVDLNSLVATVSVLTNDEVAMVKLDGVTMHYAGNNLYQLSKAGLNNTQSLTIEAYANHQRSSLLERKTYQVK